MVTHNKEQSPPTDGDPSPDEVEADIDRAIETDDDPKPSSGQDEETRAGVYPPPATEADRMD